MHEGPLWLQVLRAMFCSSFSFSGPGWWLWVDVGWCSVRVAPWGPDYVEGLASEVPALGCLGTLTSPENPFLSTAASWSPLSLRF